MARRDSSRLKSVIGSMVSGAFWQGSVVVIEKRLRPSGAERSRG